MSEGQKFTPKSEQEIRDSVIVDYDLDDTNEDNKPFIDKLVNERLAGQNEKADFHKKLGQAINQKKKRDEIINSLKNAKIDDDADESEDNGSLKPQGQEPQPTNPQIDTSRFVTKEDLENFQLRQKHSYLTDEEFQAVNAIAKGSGKGFEETLNNNSVIKSYLESHKNEERLADAVRPPSGRTSVETKQTPANKIAEMFNAGLPKQFRPKDK